MAHRPSAVPASGGLVCTTLAPASPEPDGTYHGANATTSTRASPKTASATTMPSSLRADTVCMRSLPNEAGPLAGSGTVTCKTPPRPDWLHRTQPTFGPSRYRYRMEIVYPPVIGVAKTMFRVLDLRIQVEGAEHIPATGGAVLASNHVSYLDFIFCGLGAQPAKRLVRFMA